MAAWNPNWETTEGVGKLPCEALNELRDAILPLIEIDGSFTLHENCHEVLAYDLIRSTQAGGATPSNSWFSSFDNAISYLLSGDISLEWTREEILAEIGDTPSDDPTMLVPKPKNFYTSAAWMYQRKKLLVFLQTHLT